MAARRYRTTQNVHSAPNRKISKTTSLSGLPSQRVEYWRLQVVHDHSVPAAHAPQSFAKSTLGPV